MTSDRYPPTKEHPEGKLKTPRPEPMPTPPMLPEESRASKLVWSFVFVCFAVVIVLLLLKLLLMVVQAL